MSSKLTAGSRSPREKRIGGRSILLGLLLISGNSLYIVRLERVLFGPYPSTIALFANVLFVLFVLVGINRLLIRFMPRLAFSPIELLTTYTMLAISTGLAGLDGIPSLNQIIAHGGWFGKQNNWSFLGAFPSWLVVSNQNVLRGHFLGHSSLYQASVLRAWMVPIGCWTIFVCLLLFVANCVNVLVRKQWADQERLTFPIIWLPVAMTEGGDGRRFFSNRVMWIGFAVAAGLNLWNGLAFLFPSLPSVPLGITDLKPYLTVRPWSAIDWFPITFYPFVVGLGYLLPLDLLFSAWFFFLYWKAQLVVSNAFGWDITPDFPFVKEQGFGAIVGLFLCYLWTGRHTYAWMLRDAWRRDREEAMSGTREALSSRAALIGAAAGLAGLLAFCLAAQVQLWVAVLFFALYIPTLIVVTRIRAEFGPPVHDFHFMGPDNMIPRVFGIESLRPHDLSFLTFGYAFTRAHRSDTMPVGLEGLQMARLHDAGARRMFLAILLAVAVGTLAAFWAFEDQAYRLGAATRINQGFGFANEAFNRMNGWVGGSVSAQSNSLAISAMAAGLVVTWLLFFLRLRFFGFPLHPIGYAIASSWAINLVWVPLLIAWVLKSLTLRYGGLRAYGAALPFFLGLILGDAVMGTLWGLVSLGFQIRTYNFFGA